MFWCLNLHKKRESYFKQKYIVTLVIAFKMAHCCCFRLGENLDVPDFLQKWFITLITALLHHTLSLIKILLCFCKKNNHQKMEKLASAYVIQDAESSQPLPDNRSSGCRCQRRGRPGRGEWTPHPWCCTPSIWGKKEVQIGGMDDGKIKLNEPR